MPRGLVKPEHSGYLACGVGAPGAEQGIDPFGGSASARFGDLKRNCVIDVADFTSESVSLKRLTNEEFVKLMASETQVASGDHTLVAPPVVATARKEVRWVNIGGIDWNVMKALAVRYNLHTLSLEDVIHEQGHNQSKADYYPTHLFIRILCHTLGDDNDVDADIDAYDSIWRSPRALDSTLERGQFPKNKLPSPRAGQAHPPSDLQPHDTQHFTGLTGFHAPAHEHQLLKIRALTRGDRVSIMQEPLFIFLLRNDTVISIHPRPNAALTAPITERLMQKESMLRTSEDASLLVESLLDLVVDRILEITDKYQEKIYELEHDVLLRPNMQTIRSLHILSGDVIMHKRTLEPIRAMIYGLRRYDVDRSIALADSMDPAVERSGSGVNEIDHPADAFSKKADKAEGYLSYKSKIYLADVQDHIEFVLASFDMFSGISENLINYAFNGAAYEMNQIMRRLTLATIIFLPPALLTGYFGMNFHTFPVLDSHSYILFWAIVLPVMGALVPIFMFTDIKKIVQYAQKRMVVRETIKSYGR